MSSDGNQYICVLIDYFTKWVEAYPIASKTAEVVTACIVKFIYRFGAPKRILTDQGREFVNQITREVCELFGVKRSLCSPYHPQTNGLVENMNGTIQRILGKLCQDKPQNWDTYLGAVLFTIRTKKQLTTQDKRSSSVPKVGSSAVVSSDIENSIESVWSGRSGCVLMAKIGPYKIFDMDIARLAPGKELESEVINAYILTLVKKHNQTHEEKAYMKIDSFPMTQLWQGSHQILRKCKPSHYKVFLGVINEHNHWTLAAIYPSQKRTVFLDPMGKSQTNVTKCLKTTRDFMRKKGCKVSGWTCNSVPHPRQRDGTSCGVFICKFAEQILQDEPVSFLNTDQAVAHMRKDMAVFLIQESG
ncbi:hypothetical protein SRHO_G00038640 [Serrasalmus rhombeus]